MESTRNANKNVGWAALHRYVRDDDCGMIRKTLKMGIYINAVDVDGRTPLHVAAAEGSYQALRTLIEMGLKGQPEDAYMLPQDHGSHTSLNQDLTQSDFLALFNIDIKDFDRNTPLHCAAANGHVKIMKCLLAHRADIHAQNKHGSSPLHSATESGHLNTVEFLLEESPTSFFGRNNDGQTATHVAAMYGRCKVLKLLLETTTAADICLDNNARSPMHLAAMNGKSDAITQLRDVDHVTRQDVFGYSPLHLAAIAGHAETAYILLACNADPNLVDNTGETCLHQAVRRQDIKMIHVLIDGGVDPSVADHRLKTSIDKAEEIPNERRRIDVLSALFIRPPSPTDTITAISTDEWFRASARHGRDLPRLIRDNELYPASHQPYSFRPMKRVEKEVAEDHIYEGAYKMDTLPRGRAIILNNQKFSQECTSTRQGSEIDVRRFTQLFTQLGFDVVVWRDLNAKEMDEKIQAEKAQMTKGCSAFVFVVMSHGGPGFIKSSDGHQVEIDKSIIEPFDGNNCPKLQNKPKIFFFQACRGQARELPPSPDCDGDTFRYTNSTYPGEGAHPNSDIVEIYSTYKGCKATRLVDNGAWFIEEFVLMCELFAHEADLVDLFSKANQALEHRKSHYDASVQTAQINSSLRKRLYFFPGYCRTAT